MIYGRRLVLEALRSPRPPRQVWVARGASGPGIREILSLAAELGIAAHQVSRARVESLARDGVHQGVVAEVEPFSYVPLEQLIGVPGPRVLVALDRVYDPQNLGAVARNAETFGASGLVIPARHAGSVTAVARKAAAGALEFLPVARVTNLARALDRAREEGFWVVALDPGGEVELSDAEAPGERLLLVLGSEGKGIRPGVLSRADLVVCIGMRGRLGSLNVASAAAIALYRFCRGLPHPGPGAGSC